MVRLSSVVVIVVALAVTSGAAYGAACSTTAAGSTALEKAANGLAAGEWCKMAPSIESGASFAALLQPCDPSDAPQITQYANAMGWDATNGRLYFDGAGHGGDPYVNPMGLIRYDESSDTWYALDHSEVTPHSCSGGSSCAATSPWTGTMGACGGCTTAHAYDGNTVDGSGNLYATWMTGSNMYKFNGTSWSTIAMPASQPTAALSYHPGVGTSGSIYAWLGGAGDQLSIYRYDIALASWSLIGSAIFAGEGSRYHGELIYHPGGQFIWAMGGNGSTSRWKIDSAGTMTSVAAAPMGGGVTTIKCAPDPASDDKFICYSVSNADVSGNGTGWYIYDFGDNTWTAFPSAGITDMFAPNSASGNTGEQSLLTSDIPEYGVTVWIMGTGDGTGSGAGMYVVKTSVSTPACADGTDNDGDGMIDLLDPSCADASDTDEDAPGSAYETLCKDADVVRCYSFEDQTDITTGNPTTLGEAASRMYDPSGGVGDCTLQSSAACWDLDTSTVTTGKSALRFQVPDGTGSDTSGSFRLNFADDYSQLFGEGEEFWVQYRYRVSTEMIHSFDASDGYKSIIIGTGDYSGAGSPQNSCSDLEAVVQTDNRWLGPYMYQACPSTSSSDRLEWSSAACGGNVRLQDVGSPYCCYGTYPGGCWTWAADEWMTIKMHIDVTTWNTNGGALVQMWAGYDGQDLELVYDTSISGTASDFAGNVYNSNTTDFKYGKLWMLPYNTNKDSAEVHDTGYIWYDDLIISVSDLSPVAGVCGDGTPDPGETCDDGDTSVTACVYGDESPYTQVCAADCLSYVDCSSPQYCDDGTIQAGEGEQCDDGATNGTISSCCSSTCQYNAVDTACSDDGNVCTDDACTATGTCLHSNNTDPCDDSLYCNGADTCASGTCSTHAGDPCPDGGSGDGDSDCSESCEESTDTCQANDDNGAACDLGLFCYNGTTYQMGSEVCTTGVCTAVQGSLCTDANICTDDVCNDSTDACVYTFDSGNDPSCLSGSRCSGNFSVGP